MRYAAPADVGGINLSSGPLVVTDGFVDVPDDATVGDLGGLATYGFVAVYDDDHVEYQIQMEVAAAESPRADDHDEPTA